MTNPSLSLSNGIDALFGSSDPLKAVNAANPPTATSDTAASVPPATITSASPTWMDLYASPIDCVPVAHAVTTLILFPRRPNAIETFPAAMLEIIIGTANGFTLFGPFLSNVLVVVSIIWRLPTPHPTDTPILVVSSFSRSSPASSIASFVAATAYCENNSIRLAAFGDI